MRYDDRVGTAKGRFPMYIGVGTLVAILVIVAIVYLIRRV